MPSGGYRQPRNPAVVSGPGSLSQRTDGNPAKRAADAVTSGGGGHRTGNSRPMNRLLNAAPIAKAATGTPPSPQDIVNAAQATQSQPPQQAPLPSMQPPVPLSAGTMLPDEPVTAGAPTGAGPNSIPGIVPNAGQPYKSAADQLKIMAQATGSPDLAYLAGLAGNGNF